MRNTLLTFILGFFMSQMAWSQILVSSEQVGELSRSEITDIIGQEAGPYGVKLYKIRYTMLDHTNSLDTVSGMIVIPDTEAKSHLVIYCHGTSNDKLDVPSQQRSGLIESLGFSSFGFTTAAPDYAGLGESEGYHPYINAESEARAGLYIIDIAYTIMGSAGVNLGGKLFIAGYSQGGHAGMALHEYIDTELSQSIEVTACAFGSGPYSVSQTMRELISGDEEYVALGFVPFFIRGQQEIYGNIYNELSDMFKPAYIPAIESFIEGNSSLTAASLNMATTMFVLEGEIKPKHLLQDDIVARLQANDPNDNLAQVLLDNDVHNYVPDVPVNLYYCDADAIVPYENTLVAVDDMQMNGSTTVQAVQVDPNLDHGPCAEATIPLMVNFFLGFTESDVNEVRTDLVKDVYPNPTGDWLNISLDRVYDEGQFIISSIEGRMIAKGAIADQMTSTDVSALSPGMYILQIQTNEGYQMTTFIKK